MKTPSRPAFGESNQSSDDEAEILRVMWEHIRRRLRRTSVAMRRNQCELEAIRAQLGTEIRSLEQHGMIASLTGLSLTAPDAGLRRAAGELLELLETRQSAEPQRSSTSVGQGNCPGRKRRPMYQQGDGGGLCGV